MTALVITAEAEAASALLFRTLGAHRVAVANLKPRRSPRLRATSVDDPEQNQCQATLVRLLSITEAFASELLLREVDQTVMRAGTMTVDSLWNNAAIRGTNTWQDQQKSYKQWLGINEDWKAVERLAEARNAVAHGLGTLTRRQRRDEQSVRQG